VCAGNPGRASCTIQINKFSGLPTGPENLLRLAKSYRFASLNAETATPQVTVSVLKP
jgi:hypothetical protein